MIQQKDLFVVGLGSFLVMQLCYIVAFVKTTAGAGKVTTQAANWPLVLPFVVYGACFLSVLYQPITGQVGTKGLLWPVVAYSACLCSMGAAAALRRGKVSGVSYKWVLVGAILFILSDSLIALNKFWQHFSAATFLIMTTYAAAQWFIVWGIYQSKKTN